MKEEVAIIILVALYIIGLIAVTIYACITY